MKLSHIIFAPAEAEPKERRAHRVYLGVLLTLISLGIGLLWVEPYYEQTFANLFLDVTGELPAVDCRV